VIEHSKHQLKVQGATQTMGKTTAMAVVAAAAIALLLLPLGQAEEKPTAAHPHGLPFESPLGSGEPRIL